VTVVVVGLNKAAHWRSNPAETEEGKTEQLEDVVAAVAATGLGCEGYLGVDSRPVLVEAWGWLPLPCRTDGGG